MNTQEPREDVATERIGAKVSKPMAGSPSDGPAPAQRPEPDGWLRRLFGRFIGAAGPRAGARDTDPGH